MMKDLASATSSPPVEFTADSYLMKNCMEFPYLLYFEKETGLNFGCHGAVCNPSESGESGSANCNILLPTKKFFCSGQSADVVSHATVSYFLFFHLIDSLRSFYLFFGLVKFF
jgi:hypothetical protein